MAPNVGVNIGQPAWVATCSVVDCTRAITPDLGIVKPVVHSLISCDVRLINFNLVLCFIFFLGWNVVLVYM